MGETDNGHAIIMEASASKTSAGAGPSTLEMLLIGMGACASSEVVSLLQKMKHNVDSITLEMEAKQANNVPRVFTKVQAIFTITGWGVSLAKAEEVGPHFQIH